MSVGLETAKQLHTWKFVKTTQIKNIFLSESLNEWISEWMNEWMNKWLDELMND